MSHFNRRNFLTGLAVGGAASFFSPSLIAWGANERLRVGVIGLGIRGGALLRALAGMDEIDVVALADPDSSRVAPWHMKFPKAKTCADMRFLFDDPEIDAVVIATCNHWHALAAIRAMESGKDVYVEKPLALSFWEGRQVVNAARKYKKMVQLGTQMRTDPAHAEIKRFLHEEKALGKILGVRINRFFPRLSIGLRQTPLVVPKEIDYNLWLGPARDLPLYRDRLHYDWHFVWNTGNGETGNWGAHLIDDVRNDVLCDRVAFPKRVLTAAARTGYRDAGETPNTLVSLFDTGGIPVAFGISGCPDKTDRRSSGEPRGPKTGYVVQCEGGRYEKVWGHATAFDADGKTMREFDCAKEVAGVPFHLKNFRDAIVSRDYSSLNAEIEIGYHTSGWYNSANAAYRVGHAFSKKEALELAGEKGPFAEILDDVEKYMNTQGIKMEGGDFRVSPFLEPDAEKACFVGESAAEANALFDIQYRAPFVVPEVILPTRRFSALPPRLPS